MATHRAETSIGPANSMKTVQGCAPGGQQVADEDWCRDRYEHPQSSDVHGVPSHCLPDGVGECPPGADGQAGWWRLAMSRPMSSFMISVVPP